VFNSEEEEDLQAYSGCRVPSMGLLSNEDTTNEGMRGGDLRPQKGEIILPYILVENRLRRGGKLSYWRKSVPFMVLKGETPAMFVHRFVFQEILQTTRSEITFLREGQTKGSRRKEISSNHEFYALRKIRRGVKWRTLPY